MINTGSQLLNTMIDGAIGGAATTIMIGILVLFGRMMLREFSDNTPKRHE